MELSFSQQTFQEEARHVLVICQYKDVWILTNHKIRGLEFPGGKLEAGETIEETARREVYEETGALVGELIRIGNYRVMDPKGTFVKAVFWGKIEKMHVKDDYLETNGPIAVKGDILKLRFDDKYSFIMKDKVIEECIKHIEKVER